MTLKAVKNTQFAAMFPAIIYDSEQVAEPSLDIWSAFYTFSTPIGFDEELTGIYRIASGDTLEGIANNLYGNVYLWWLIPLANNISDPFDFLANAMQEDSEIKVYKPEFLSQILGAIRTQVKKQNVDFERRIRK